MSTKGWILTAYAGLDAIVSLGGSPDQVIALATVLAAVSVPVFIFTLVHRSLDTIKEVAVLAAIGAVASIAVVQLDWSGVESAAAGVEPVLSLTKRLAIAGLLGLPTLAALK